jgi:hypothetical protein
MEQSIFCSFHPKNLQMADSSGLYGLITTLKDKKPILNNKFDAIVLIMHLIAKQNGFTCVGTDSSDEKGSILFDT